MAEEEKSASRTLALALFAFLARSLQQIATFVITLLAARFLLPAEYGVYAIAIIFITLVQTLTYTGFYQWIVNSKESDNSVLNTAFLLIFALTSVGSLLLALASKPLSWAFDAPDLFYVLLALAVVQPIAGMGAWYSAVLLRRGAVQLHFTIMFFQNLVAMFGGVVLLISWQSIFALVAFRYLRVFTGLLLYVLFSTDQPKFALERSLLRQAMNFAGGLYAGRFLTFLSRYSGDLLLGLFFTTAEAGLYRFGSRIAGGATDIVTQPMASFALAQFGATARNDHDLADPLRRFTGSITLLVGVVASLVIVLGPEVVDQFFDPAYAAALGVVFAMALRSFFGIGERLLEPVMSALDKTHLVARFNFAWTFITIASIFTVAPFGLSVLAWSQVNIMILRTLHALWYISKQDVPVAGALRSFGYAIALSLVNCAVLFVAVTLGLDGRLLLGCLIGLLLGVVTLTIGRKLRIFHLSVFSS